ncbi:T6SS effector BTH_I2691 family protein [Pseudomonas sp. NPDC089401]|uniref:T6SS effector BTH_I2691 family protein n=1 Tax=Pseudomonas sp. NPDC089401 TaxID=3364462 RepID=UPI0038262A87
MSISKAISIAMQEEIPNPYGTCNACERSGLPILLLREAYAPRPRDTQSYLVAYDSEITHTPLHPNQLRVLRQGYVYVLLDQEIWHAYQVTPEGALRRFPVSQMPMAPGASLHKHCETKDHDVIASFINIHTQLFSKAWIAFANDPWPRDVLDRYRDGIAAGTPKYLERFVELDLNTVRNDPASLGIAMTDAELGLDDVLEYSTYSPGKFVSCHGYYPRLSRLFATLTHVRTTIQKEQLPNGVLALTLPDPVGLVMEANAQRTTWFRSMQEWRAEPQRHFELFTSQALLGIRELNEARAAIQAVKDTENEAKYTQEWNENPIGFKAYLPPVDIEAKAPRNIERKQQEARERLEDRYDEKARAKFQAAYDRELKLWQSMVDQVGALYTHFYVQRAFQRIGHLDYSATSRLSAEYFIGMMSACLAGGPTELPVHKDAELEPTQELWQQLLEDPNSLLYQALMAKHQDLMPQIVHGLTGDDLYKLHDSIKGIIATSEGKRFMIQPVQDAIGQLLAAANSASNTIGQHITAQTKALIGHVHRAAFLLFAGQSVTQIRLSLTLGEYMSLLNESLQERTNAYLSKLDEQFRKPAARKIRAMVLSGAINLAAPGNRHQLIEVMLWTFESTENLQSRILKLRESGSGSVSELVRDIAIGTKLTTQSVKVSAEAARHLASEAFQSIRGAATGAGQNGFLLMLALGSLWFNKDSLDTNYQALLKTSNTNPEALAAIGSSSFGVLGASIEGAGFAVKILRPERILPEASNALSLGARISNYGTAVAALAGAFDATQYAHAALRTMKQGDKSASLRYITASGLAASSAVAGIMGITFTTLLGPLGFAILAGLIAYGMASSAKREESNLLELWARRSKWGIPYDSQNWLLARDLDVSIGALNAAALGVTADVSIAIRLGYSTQASTGIVFSDPSAVPAAFVLSYFLCLPNYEFGTSRYEWSLNIYGAGENRGLTLSSSDSSASGLYISPPSQIKNFFPDAILAQPTVKLETESNSLTIQGELILSENHSIQAIELALTYWPDTADEKGFAKLITREDKIKPQKIGY